MFSPLTTRRILLTALVLLAASQLPACELLEEGDLDGWDAYPKHLPLTPVWKKAPTEEVFKHCGKTDNFLLQACAVRDYTTGLCFIYANRSEARTPKDVVVHEKKHCQGYDHPSFVHLAVSNYRR